MTFFHVPRRRPARPNPNVQPKASYVPDILAAWDEAQAKADAEAAAEAELHREIDARKRGNDRLSTIEAVYDVLAERDLRAAALPSTEGSTPPAPQPGAAPPPDAGMLREGAVTPAFQQIPSMPAGTGGIDDILTLGPFALLAQAYRDALGDGAIDGPSATPWTAYVDRSPPAPLARDNQATSPAGAIERASFEPQSPGPAQPPRTAEDVQAMGPPPADRGYGDRPTFDPCGAAADAAWLANRELDRVRQDRLRLADEIAELRTRIAQIKSEAPSALFPRLSPPKRNDRFRKWALNAAENAYKIDKYEKERSEIEKIYQTEINPLQDKLAQLTQQLDISKNILKKAENEADYRAYLSRRCNNRGEK